MLVLGGARAAQGPRLRGGAAQLGRRRRCSGGVATRSTSATSASHPRSPRRGRARRRRPPRAARCDRRSGSPPGRSRSDVVRELGSLLSWTKGSMALGDELAWLPLAVGALGLAAIVVLAYVLFRPLGAAAASSPTARRAQTPPSSFARTAGTRSRSSSCARDAHYLFSPDRRAFVGYRVANGVLLISGDPVGDPDVAPGARRRDAAPSPSRAGCGSPRSAPARRSCRSTARPACASLYLGDEAIVDTRGFSLEGRAIRKVRQSVSRLEAAGYTRRGARLRGSRRGGAPRARARLGALARRRRRSAASRWRWTASAASTTPAASSSLARDAGGDDPRLPPLRAELRAPRDVALVHAPRPRDAERADRVPRRQGDRAAARAGRWRSCR